MAPHYIPTVTGRKGEHLRNCYAVCSPSAAKPEIIRGKILTIVDCHTFYLQKAKPNRNEHAFKHYQWYIEFVRNRPKEQTLVYVAPDFDWIPKEYHQALFDQWVAAKITKPCLVVPNFVLFNYTANVVGHALNQKQTGPVHPVWTHSFSREFKQLEGETQIWTYDAIWPL